MSIELKANTMSGRIFSINIGREKGKPKDAVSSAFLKEGYGIEGDAHAGFGNRQISLLAVEDIEVMEATYPSVDFRPGIFAENITTSGIGLSRVKIGYRLSLGDEVVLRIEQIGKSCHSGCAIMKETGCCIMPKKGIFASVEKGGEIKFGDHIKILK